MERDDNLAVRYNSYPCICYPHRNTINCHLSQYIPPPPLSVTLIIIRSVEYYLQHGMFFQGFRKHDIMECVFSRLVEKE